MYIYKVSRRMLTLAMALLAYVVALAVILASLKVPPDKRGLVWIVLTVCVIAVLARRKVGRLFTSGGTAAWASHKELERAGMLASGKGGLILGRVKSDGTPLGQAVKALLNPRIDAKDACRAFFDSLNRSRRKQGRLVKLPQAAVHTMICAPVGAGKSTGLVIPFLMTCEESCAVVDFKGELAKVTAEQRQRMGHNIIILDPFQVVTQSKKFKGFAATFNPLDFIDKDSPQALDDCRDLAEALVIRTGEEKDPHWNDSAEAVIAAVIAVVVMYGQKDKGTRSLQDAREILAHPQKFAIARKLMLEHGGMLARWGGQLEHLKGDEFASVMSTCHRHMRFLDTLAITASTGNSSFDPAALRKGKMTVYLVLPPEHMRAQSALLRMWIGSMFRAVVKGGLGESNRVHFVLDEAASLGHMEALDDAVDKYRGYGVRLQFYYQSLGQLKKCFPSDEGQTLLSNTTKIFFGCNDYQTAEFISKTLGNETIIVESGGSTSGWGRNRSTSTGGGHSESSGSSTSGGTSSNWQQQSRELAKPDEIMQLDQRIAITLTPGVRPVRTRLVRYYEEKSLFRRRGWLTRAVAASWTMLISAALLLVAITGAVAITSDLCEAFGWQQKQQTAPPQTPPPLFRP